MNSLFRANTGSEVFERRSSMNTKHAVSKDQGDLVDVTPTDPGDELDLRPERVQDALAARSGGLVFRVTAQQLLDPAPPVAAEPDATYIYEVAIDQPQRVTIKLPLLTVTLHGNPAVGGQTGSARADLYE
jgi:hypothetical protein